MNGYVPDTGMLDHAERLRTADTDMLDHAERLRTAAAPESNVLLETLRLRHAELQIEQAAIDARLSEVRSLIDQISTPRRQRRSRTQQPPSDEPAS